nr:alpha-galactosidase [Lachnospiraceae bacterium]
MSVFYSARDRIFYLHTAGTSYQMMVDELGYLFHLYYGPRTERGMESVLVYEDHGFSGNPAEKRTERGYSLNTLPQEYPFWGAGDYRNTAFLMEDPVTHAQGADLRFSSYRIQKGKFRLQMLPSARGAEPDDGFASENGAASGNDLVSENGTSSDSGIDTLELVLKDAVSGVEAVLYYSVYEAEDMITKNVVIRNSGKEPVLIRRAATHCLDLTEGDWDLIHFQGRHTMER